MRDEYFEHKSIGYLGGEDVHAYNYLGYYKGFIDGDDDSDLDINNETEGMNLSEIEDELNGE